MNSWKWTYGDVKVGLNKLLKVWLFI